MKLEVRAPVGWPVFATLAPAATPCARPGHAQRGRFLRGRRLPDPDGPRSAGAAARRGAAALPGRLRRGAGGPRGRRCAGRRGVRPGGSDWFASTPFPHYTAMIEYLRPVSSAAPVRLQHGAPGEQHLLPRHHARAPAPTSPGRARGAGAVQLRAPYRALVDSQAALRAKGISRTAGRVPPVIDTHLVLGRVRPLDRERGADRHGIRGRSIAKRCGSDSRERWQAILDGFPAVFRTTSLVDLSRVGSTQYSEDFRIGQTLYTPRRAARRRARRHDPGAAPRRRTVAPRFDPRDAGVERAGEARLPGRMSCRG